MASKRQAAKAIVHVSGTLLRQTWRGPSVKSCIVVRPSGKERDNIAYVVNQVKFNGPSEMVFSTKRRNTPRDPRDLCAQEEENAATKSARSAKKTDKQGYVGTLPGFDNAILVYLEADEGSILVQPKQGDKYIAFAEFKEMVSAKRLNVPTIFPLRDFNC